MLKNIFSPINFERSSNVARIFLVKTDRLGRKSIPFQAIVKKKLI